MVSIDYQVKLSPNAVSLLGNIRILSSAKKEERREEIIAELQDLVRLKDHPGCPYEDPESRIESLTTQLENPFPRRARYETATRFGELERMGEEIGFTRSQVGYYLRNYLYGLIGVVIAREKCSYPVREELPHSTEKFTITGERIHCVVVDPLRQEGVYIPGWIEDGVGAAIDDFRGGHFLFEGSVESSSREILRYIYERSMELRAQHGNNWYPEFTITELRKRVGISEAKALEATRDLVGILAERVYDKTRGRFQKKLFLPKCRFSIAEDLVGL
jgi:hypothetical protein